MNTRSDLMPVLDELRRSLEWLFNQLIKKRIEGLKFLLRVHRVVLAGQIGPSGL